MWLVVQGRELRYNETALRQLCPFLLQDVAFNAIYVEANEVMAKLAMLMQNNTDAAHFQSVARTTRAAMQSQMWNG
jgi:hypothetical protein